VAKRHTRRIKRTSLNLDLELVGQAREVLQTSGTTDTVHRALEEVVRRDALRRLAEWRPDLTLEELERIRQPRTEATFFGKDA
jgi:Arc/MetJ family transcription regulator